MKTLASNFLSWHADRILLLGGKPREGLASIVDFVWFIGVIVPTTLLLMPLLIIAGLIESCQR